MRATSLNLLSVLNTGLARGVWLDPGTAREPVAVLGSVAARRLGIDRTFSDHRVWLGGQWFNVAGVLEPSPLEPDIDIVIPVEAWTGGIASPVVIGALAGLLPAVRASRLAPTVALRTA